MKCPICNSELKITGDMAEDGREECQGGHYEHRHSYGNHQESYSSSGGHVSLSIGWHYTEWNEDRSRREALVEAFLEWVK